MDDKTKNIIQNHIDTNDVCLFMKGTPDAPQCGFSMAVSNMLKILEVNFKSVNVLEDQSIREGIKIFSDWPTIPQLYVKKEFVGGCDIVKEMYESGELKKVFSDKGINFKIIIILSNIQLPSLALNCNLLEIINLELTSLLLQDKELLQILEF